MSSPLLNQYVIVRCNDAGVHAGILQSHEGRQCLLKDSRRLWYWRPANGAAFLSGVAVYGLAEGSKVGATVPLLLLTENCEIAVCSEAAAKNISEYPAYTPE